jgi:hypothetical protein
MSDKDPFARLMQESQDLSCDDFVRMLGGSGGPTRRDLVSIQDLAVELGVSIRTLRRWNKLPDAPKRYRRGHSLMHRRADVQTWFERSKRTSGRGDDTPGDGSA